jgi:cation diffusion facilitator family transporter
MVPVHFLNRFGVRGDHLRSVAAQISDASSDALRVSDVPEGSLLVSCDPVDRHDVDVLVTFEAPALKLEDGRCVFVPYGDGDSGLRAAKVAIELAVRFDLVVVFYHTTWPSDKAVESLNPKDHVCYEAKVRSAQLDLMAQAAGVQHRFVTEMAKTVNGGITTAALRENAALIVMVRGDCVLSGSYVDQMSGGTVPLYIANLAESVEAPSVSIEEEIGSVNLDAVPVERTNEFLALIKSHAESPYVVMSLVLLMYIIKVVCKLAVGYTINSGMLIGDGWHNVADIFEAIVVMVTIRFSRQEHSGKYPLGPKNIESFFSVVIGGGLIAMALKIGATSAWTLATLAAGKEVAEVIVDSGTAPWAMAVTLGSSVLSLLMSRYEIHVGKISGHQIIVADGEETKSDGRIELATFIGILGLAFGVSWIEYPFAIVVAVLMIQTGYEIFDRGMGALLQRSIGLEVDAEMKELVEDFYGVVRVTSLKSFLTGEKVNLIIEIETASGAENHRALREAIEFQLVEYLKAEEHSSWEFYTSFYLPEPKVHRMAVPVYESHVGWRVAGIWDDLTHVVICDVVDDVVVRSTKHEWTNDATFLPYKRVSLMVWSDEDISGSTTRGIAGVVHKIHSSNKPLVYGVNLNI